MATCALPLVTLSTACTPAAPGPVYQPAPVYRTGQEAGAATPAAPDDARGIDQIMAEDLERTRVSGAVMVVVSGDSVVFLKAYGRARFDDTTALAPDALFPVPDLTPLVTGIAATALEAARVIDLDAPVGRYVPELRPELRDATIAQLLAQTAGLTAIRVMPPRGGDTDLDVAARRLTRHDRFTRPGMVHSRSASGIDLAGLALERAYGRPFTELMDGTVLPGLGMIASTVNAARAADRVTPGHVSRQVEAPADAAAPASGSNATRWVTAVASPPPDSAVHRPHRGLHATALDVGRLMAALLNDGRVHGVQRLRPGVIDQALRTRAVLPGPDRTTVAFGVRTDRTDGRTEIRPIAMPGPTRVGPDPDGRGSAHSAVIRLLPDLGLGIAILANADGADRFHAPDFIIRRVLGVRPPARVAAAQVGGNEPGETPGDRGTHSPLGAPGAVIRTAPLDARTLRPDRITGLYANGGELLEITHGPDGLRLHSGDMVLDLVPRNDVFHARIADGRTALRFRVLEDADGRLYLWLDDRALARDPEEPQ